MNPHSIVSSLAIIVADEQRQKTVKIAPRDESRGVRSGTTLRRGPRCVTPRSLPLPYPLASAVIGLRHCRTQTTCEMATRRASELEPAVWRNMFFFARQLIGGLRLFFAPRRSEFVAEHSREKKEAVN